VAASRELPWDEFAARNADLLRWQPSVLAEFYADDVLASPRAKEALVLPLVHV
jgi:hypothetical protein